MRSEKFFVQIFFNSLDLRVIKKLFFNTKQFLSSNKYLCMLLEQDIIPLRTTFLRVTRIWPIFNNEQEFDVWPHFWLLSRIWAITLSRKAFKNPSKDVLRENLSFIGNKFDLRQNIKYFSISWQTIFKSLDETKSEKRTLDLRSQLFCIKGLSWSKFIIVDFVITEATKVSEKWLAGGVRSVLGKWINIVNYV